MALPSDPARGAGAEHILALGARRAPKPSQVFNLRDVEHTAPLPQDPRPIEAQLADVGDERRREILLGASGDVRQLTGQAQVLGYRIALKTHLERYRRHCIANGEPLPIDESRENGEAANVARDPSASPQLGAVLPAARSSRSSDERPTGGASTRTGKVDVSAAAARQAAHLAGLMCRLAHRPQVERDHARRIFIEQAASFWPHSSSREAFAGALRQAIGAASEPSAGGALSASPIAAREPLGEVPPPAVHHTPASTSTMTDHRPIPAPRSPAPPAAAAAAVPTWSPSFDDALTAAGDPGHPLHQSLTGTQPASFADRVIGRLLETQDLRDRLPGADAASLRRVLMGAAQGHLRLGRPRQVGIGPAHRPQIHAAGHGPLADIAGCARADAILDSATRDPLRRALIDGGGPQVDAAVAEFWSLAPCREVFDSPAAARSYLVGVARRQVPARLFGKR